jgi:transcriptional regulator with PAS, ATPase and Fis domain
MSDFFDKHLLGNSGEFCTVIRAARIAAITDVTLLILGESGTGKELLAQAIHQHSNRADKPFVAINCAALPETLAESELFGHTKGAFTGAISDQQGRIQAANTGTLFLDEIGELPLNIQAKLLRFLETGECQVIGKTQIEKINTRILAATNRNLYTQVQEGKFRQDLYYRLNIVPLELPPLRKRIDDLEMLLNSFTKQLAEHHNLAAPIYSKQTIKYLRQYKWAGNIRELRNFCERMLILFSGKTITIQDLPQEFQAKQSETHAFTLPETGINLKNFEIQMIKQALHKTYGNRSQAARLLGLTRDAFLYRIKKYMIKS